MTTFDQPTIELATAGAPIGAFRNNWRQRRVTIFAHPTDPTLVVTVGQPFDGGPSINTIESRALFACYIGSFTKVFE